MRLPVHPRSARPGRRGSALLLSFLVLIVLAAIIFQLSIGTSTDARVARNDVAITTMDQAIESALMEVLDRLKTDAESAAGGAAGAGAEGGLGGLPGAGGQGGGESSQPVDSREDAWGKAQRTTINEIELRVLVQDEDSKLNVLQMLTEDEDEARKALDRVVRVIDLAREGTTADIDLGEARRMAEAMRDHMRNRGVSPVPRPKLSSDSEEQRDRGLPLTLREFEPLEAFHEGHFRDFRDERGQIVHSLGSYLTVWTSLTTAEQLAQQGGQGGQGGATAAGQQGGQAQGGAGSGQSTAGGASQQTGQGAGGQGAPGGGAPEGQQGGEGGAGTQQQGSGSTGGVAVNVNTAPAAVLKALVDDRDVPYRFWDEVIEYRNLEEEPEDGEEDPEPVYDEYGDEIIRRQVFDTLEELAQVPGYDRLTPVQRAELSQLLTTQSHVFSILITARRATGQQDAFAGALGARRPGEREDELGNALVRTVRAVVWRRQAGDEVQLIPIVRWDVLDHLPFEVLDYPDPDR